MTHLRITFLSLSLLCCGNIMAQQQQKLNIDEATVFLNGAELVSSAKLNLAKGDNEIIFSNVAGDVNAQSITVGATNDVVVTSVTFQNNYLAAEVVSPAAKAIRDSIELLTTAKEEIQIKLDVVNAELGILRVNRKDTARNVDEIIKMLDLTNARMEGYRTLQNKEDHLLKKANERITRLTKQLDEEQKKDYQPGGQLLIKFYAKEATATSVVVDYVVPNAGWSPTYDIKADNTSSPVKLFYKANIHQNSGVKWNNVRLSLSTGNPQESVQAPVLSPWYLAFYRPQPVAYKAMNAPVNQLNENIAAGTASSQSWSTIDGAQVDNTDIDNYVAVDNAGVNTSFDIDLPYTIPSDGQEHLVAIKKYDLPATYRYYAVPKLDKDAFLQAQITNWEDLNLLPGKTNIFYEGTYVGEGIVDVRNVKDTMTISLGRDKKIVVKREQDKKLHSVKSIGENQREAFVYTITVRNTRKETINLTVQDQQPVSNDKDIVLEDKDTSDSEYDEKTGMMKWAFSLGPNEVKKLTFGYTVKYPKGKVIQNLK